MYKLEDLKQGDKFKSKLLDVELTYQGNIGDVLFFINQHLNVDTRTLLQINTAYTKLEEPKPKPIKIAVHTPTLIEFLYVAEKIGNPRKLNEHHYYRENKEACISVENNEESYDKGCYANIPYYKQNNFTILSFSDWCKQNNYEVLPKLIQGFEVGDYSDKPLLLEVANGTNTYKLELITQVVDTDFPFINNIGNLYQFARKIDTSKYII